MITAFRVAPPYLSREVRLISLTRALLRAELPTLLTAEGRSAAFAAAGLTASPGEELEAMRRLVRARLVARPASDLLRAAA